MILSLSESTSGNFREYLHGDQVRLKKYFYVLRPILACRWIENNDNMPPMEFSLLVEHQLPKDLKPFVTDLLALKIAGEELALGPQIPEINAFLEEELDRLKPLAPVAHKTQPPGFDRLNALFLDTLSYCSTDCPTQA